jgi:uridine monophosphate synthetase
LPSDKGGIKGGHASKLKGMNFIDKLNGAIARNQSLLCIGLNPDPEVVPVSFYDQKGMPDVCGLETWLQALVAQTAHLVCAYEITLDFYVALGSEGLSLLRTVLSAIPEHIPVILDAKHSDLSTATVFAQTIFLQWKVDAVTLIPYAGQDVVAPFLVYPDKAVFVLCTTSNPSASVFQEYPSAELPLFLQITREAQAWGAPEQLGLEVGVVLPESLARIRQLAPERVILSSNSWNDHTLTQLLGAGLDANGDGLLIPVPQRLLSHEQPAEQTKLIDNLREEIQQERHRIASGNPTCSVWVPDVCFLEHHPYEDLILQLYDMGCIAFGDHVQSSGLTFPYYVDLRKIISNPQVFHQILTAYADVLKNLDFDRIAGIPYGSLPTATGLALRLGYPMIFPRKEVKTYGARRLIEGAYEKGETIVVIDDILITGKSVMEGAEKLKAEGLEVRDIVVLIDHGKGVKETLKQQGYQGHAVLTISEIAETLYGARRINQAQFEVLIGTSESP